MDGCGDPDDAWRSSDGSVPSPGGVTKKSFGSADCKMVAHYKVILILCVASGCAAHNRCSVGTELMPPLCPTDLPPVQTVRIVENASKSPAETAPSVSCAAFRVDENAVRRYFELARSINENDAPHTLDYSPCQASGEVVFENGQSGRWTVTQARSGTLAMTGRETLILYCPDCGFEPFQ